MRGKKTPLITPKKAKKHKNLTKNPRLLRKEKASSSVDSRLKISGMTE